MQTITKIPARAGTFTVKAKPSKNNQIFVSIFLNKDKIPVKCHYYQTLGMRNTS